jgi:hypothetical protein
MIPWAMLSRRNLIAAALGGCAAGVGERISLYPAWGNWAASISGYSALAGFCTALHCPEAIRIGCLRALPAMASPEHLASLILANLPSAEGARTSGSAFPSLVREAKRADFAAGRLVYVDGWMLSLTETRIYALSALLVT